MLNKQILAISLMMVLMVGVLSTALVVETEAQKEKDKKDKKVAAKPVKVRAVIDASLVTNVSDALDNYVFYFASGLFKSKEKMIEYNNNTNQYTLGFNENIKVNDGDTFSLIGASTSDKYRSVLVDGQFQYTSNSKSGKLTVNGVPDGDLVLQETRTNQTLNAPLPS